LIVEDEPLGHRRLCDALSRHADLAIVGWARTLQSAIAAIRSGSPDVVFLDIELPGASGLQLGRMLDPGRMPLIVFVTAHEAHAREAFDLDAVDYLLKPYADERVDQALLRVRRAQAARALGSISAQLHPIQPSEASSDKDLHVGPGSYLTRITVTSKGDLRVIPITAVSRVGAQGGYVELHVGKDSFLLRESLSVLATRLDPEQFCRIHRSHIVALDLIESYTRRGGEYRVRLRGGGSLPVGRTYRKELERRLGRL
jgi:two-component system LytT family response regulator